MSKSDLRPLVEEFVADLQSTVIAFTGSEQQLTVVEVRNHASIKIVDCDDRRGIIPLTVDGSALLGLRFHYGCVLDSRNGGLAVSESKIEVFSWGYRNREPLFRVEYLREPKTKGVPSSHIQVHAHNELFTHSLLYVGTGTRMSRKRVERDLADVKNGKRCRERI